LNNRYKKQEDGESTPQLKDIKSNPILGGFLLLIGIFGFLTGYVDLNGRAVRFPILEGPPAILMSTACISGSAVIFSGVIEQAVSKKPGRNFGDFRLLGTRIGWVLVISALVTHLILKFIK
jgi:hypothetical protein